MAVDRLIGILTVLLRSEQVTAGELAERFEVSARTIARDVDRLCRAGIPLRTVRGAGGGISIMEGFRLDHTMLTNADRAAILAGLRSLDSVSGTGYYRQLMQKLPQEGENVGDDCVVIDLASWYGPMLAPRLEELKRACTERRVVEFTYCAPGGNSRRTVKPGKLVFRWSSWYLWAWCRTREDWRLFKLNRMQDMTVKDERFSPLEAPALEPLERGFPEGIWAAVRFDAAVRWRLVDEYGWNSFSEEADGSLLFQRQFPGKDELFRWVLTFGEHAELLGPPQLRLEMEKLVEKLRVKYDRQASYYEE